MLLAFGPFLSPPQAPKLFKTHYLKRPYHSKHISSSGHTVQDTLPQAVILLFFLRYLHDETSYAWTDSKFKSIPKWHRKHMSDPQGANTVPLRLIPQQSGRVCMTGGFSSSLAPGTLLSPAGSNLRNAAAQTVSI